MAFKTVPIGLFSKYVYILQHAIKENKFEKLYFDDVQ
jgi:hypothetical protein